MVAVAVCSLQTALCGEVERPQPVFNRAPLVETPYAQLAIGDIRPEGWLRVQMQTMLDGMTGHLDEIYAKVVGDNNAWLGGEGDAWERGPYWIDGALPMAYIMGDEALKAKCVKWVEAILASQKENGYFGPDTDRPSMDGMQRDNAADWWPRMVALKILQQYYMATGDGRVIDFMTRYFRYQAETLPSKPLGHWTFWGAERGGDNLLVVYWLYDITGDESLLDLGDLIHAQSCDWTGRFTKDNHLYRQNSLHCVNLAQGFKEPVIYYQRSKSGEHLNAPIEALRRIRYTIGFPTGLWAGDELIHFGEPTRGSELCTAVEMMYSLEEMCRVTGDNRYADLLERVAYNALPTQVSPEGDARQYFQQVNQTAVTRDMRNFSTTHEDTDLVFGTLTGYPCCTCNLHQGWPKLTQNLWYANAAGGLAALVYAPCTVETALASGRRVCIEEQTCYPFEEAVRFKVSLPEKRRQAETFPLDMRIPEWSDGYTLTVNGERVEPETVGDRTIRLTRAWADGDEAVLEFNAPEDEEDNYLFFDVSEYPAATIAAVCIDLNEGEYRLPYNSSTGITKITRKDGKFYVYFGSLVPEYETGRIYFAQGIAGQTQYQLYLAAGGTLSFDEWVSVASAAVPEAPKDGKFYARKNGAWSQITVSGEDGELEERVSSLENTLSGLETTLEGI